MTFLAPIAKEAAIAGGFFIFDTIARGEKLFPGKFDAYSRPI